MIPGEHGRTKWWILAFLIPGVNVVAYYVYAFTTPERTSDSPPAYAT